MAVKTVNLIKTLKVSFLIKLRNLAAEQGTNKYKHFWNPRVKGLKQSGVDKFCLEEWNIFHSKATKAERTLVYWRTNQALEKNS